MLPAATKPPSVSVIIPCYNQAHFLAHAIESVLDQPYPHFEIIVVNDGSKDNTTKVAGRYAQVRCVSQENRGLPAARNTGIRHSRCEYLVFLDADDRLLPEALATGVRLLEAHPDCAFVSGRCNFIDEEGRALPNEHMPCVETDHYVRLLMVNYIWMPATVMYRRRIVEDVGGFDTSLRASEDYDLYLRIVRSHPIYCHSTVVAEYRQHGSSMSRDPLLMLKTALRVVRAQRPFGLQDKAVQRAVAQGARQWQNQLGDQLVTTIRNDVRARAWGKAIPEMLALLKLHPRGFARHAYRKLQRVAVGAKPEALHT